jgi:hypothetical protein
MREKYQNTKYQIHDLKRMKRGIPRWRLEGGSRK